MDGFFGFLVGHWWQFGLLLIVLVYIWSGVKVVLEWNRVPVMRFGKYVRTLGPGISWVEPFTNSTLRAVDTRQMVQTYEMSGDASLQTHDNVPISFATILTTQIDANNVSKFIVAVRFDDNPLEARTLSTVSEIASRTELNELLHDRSKICAEIRSLLEERVSDWGIHIVAVELRDVKITDPSIQEAIALKARAAKEADAEMVRAEAQVGIAKELNLAASELSQDGWELKRMEVMLELCRSANLTTVLFPSDALSALSAIKPAQRGN